MDNIGRRGFLGGFGALLGFATVPKIIQSSVEPIIPVKAIDLYAYSKLLLEYTQFVTQVTGELNPTRVRLSRLIEGMVIDKLEAERKISEFYHYNRMKEPSDA